MSAAITQRELELFEIYVAEDSIDRAAARAGVSRQTLKNTVTSVLRKTDAVSSRQAAYRIWGRAGAVTRDTRAGTRSVDNPGR